jgi:hypothetical protein
MMICFEFGKYKEGRGDLGALCFSKPRFSFGSGKKDQMEYTLCKSEPNPKDRTQIPANPSFKSQPQNHN